MQVTFTRTGARRYRVTATRETGADLIMEPAPGFDEHLPHDLVHFLVERHWGLAEGIYDDLAAGGDAGTFRPVEGARGRRATRKQRGLATSGRDMDQSELLAAAVFAAWQVHRRAVRGDSVYAQETAAAAGVSDAEIAAIIPACDEAATRWAELPIGGSVAFEWSPPRVPGGRQKSTAPRPRATNRR